MSVQDRSRALGTDPVVEAAAMLEAMIDVLAATAGGHGSAIDGLLGDTAWALHESVYGPPAEGEDACYHDARIVEMYARTGELAAVMLRQIATELDMLEPREEILERAARHERHARQIRDSGTVAVD